MMARRRFHRVVFALAGGYNLAWGVYAVLDPQWLFRFAGLPLQNYPQIFACLGLVIGLYGILYLEVARLPERGWLLAAVADSPGRHSSGCTCRSSGTFLGHGERHHFEL